MLQSIEINHLKTFVSGVYEVSVGRFEQSFEKSEIRHFYVRIADELLDLLAVAETLKVQFLKENFFWFELIAEVMLQGGCWVYLDANSVDLVYECVREETSKDRGIRKEVLMSNRESMFERSEVLDLDAHYLKIFVPNYKDWVRLWSEINMWKSAFLDVAAMFFLVENHSNFKCRLNLAECDKWLATDGH